MPLASSSCGIVAEQTLWRRWLPGRVPIKATERSTFSDGKDKYFDQPPSPPRGPAVFIFYPSSAIRNVQLSFTSNIQGQHCRSELPVGLHIRLYSGVIIDKRPTHDGSIYISFRYHNAVVPKRQKLPRKQCSEGYHSLRIDKEVNVQMKSARLLRIQVPARIMTCVEGGSTFPKSSS